MSELAKPFPAAGNKEKNGFLSGVFLLTVSTVLVKVLGLLYRIPMLGYLGAEGMGYFNTAFELYAFLGTTVTAGLPVALAVCISGALAKGNYAAVGRFWRAASLTFAGVGTVGAAAIALFSAQISVFLKSPASRASVLAVAPALLFTCLGGALRGYFQGFGNMLPTAVSQLIEAGGKLAFGLLFAAYAVGHGYDTATVSAYSVVGCGVGTLASFLYLAAEKKRWKTPETECVQSAPVPTRDRAHRLGTLRVLLAVALPVTVSSAVMGVTRVVDMTVILRRLQAVGYSSVYANELYGSYTTLALPLFHLVPSLVTSVALPLLPSLSYAHTSGDTAGEREILSSAFRLTAFVAMPATLGLAAFATPILRLLFAGQEQAISVAAPLLSLLGASVVFSALMTVTGAVLQAYGKVYVPIRAMLAGIAVKTVSAYFLVGNASVGILGAPVSTFLCGFTVAVAEMYRVLRLAPAEFSVGAVLSRPFASAAVSVGVSYALFFLYPQLFAGRIGSAVIFALCGVLYLLLAFATGSLQVSEAARTLPFVRQHRTKHG